MTTVWLGDFRCNQLKQYQKRLDVEETENYKYITENTAEYSWFKNTAVVQLPHLSLDTAIVVIMLGFNDCIYSCAWNTVFDINDITNKYIAEINSLVGTYTSVSFYVCSVDPVTSDYHFANYSDTGVIPADILNARIRTFNTKIKENCLATFIDSNSYLSSINFSTRDGVCYTSNTCGLLYNYIKNHLRQNVGVPFIPRSTESDAPDPEDDSFLYWKHTSAGGYNKCTIVQNGCVLPNCVGYAWGRFMEISESYPTLATEEDYPSLSAGDAGMWFDHKDGYDRGTVPRVGAVICWQEPGEAGHVGIVEVVNADGTIITSESGWVKTKPAYNRTDHFWVTERKYDEETKNWRQSSNGKFVSSWIDGYIFQGFIYNPRITSAGVSGPCISKAMVESSANDYFGETKQQTNARYIWQYLGSRGWTLNAVAGIIGNMQTESTMNPGLMEAKEGVAWPSSKKPSEAEIEDYVQRYYNAKGRFPGYGLTQWTSTEVTKWSDHKLVKWCKANGLDYRDIDSQLKRILYECEQGIQFGSTETYPMTFKEFSTSNEPPDYLAKVFLKNYERPANPDYEQRGKQGQAWYDYLLPFSPEMKPPLSLANVRVDQVTSTSLKASFITRSSLSYAFKITEKQTNKLVKQSTVTIDSEDTSSCMKFIIEYGSLEPSTEYNLYVEVFGEVDEDTLNETISFVTPQSYPDAVTKIVLTSVDTALPNVTFNLEASDIQNWGYWEKTSDYGYEVILFVNGNAFSNNKTGSLASLSAFNLKEVFMDYEPKIGDTIQIGIRTWVKPTAKTIVYDSPTIKTSNPICFLKRPVRAYIKND